MENLHLTLAFVGPVDEETARCLETAAATVQPEPFTLVLDEVGQFRGSRVVWLGASRVPEPLAHLVALLSRALEPCGYRPDPRPFRPHVTLLRNGELATPGPVEVAPIEWPVDGFVLVESVTAPQGARYRVLKSFSGHAA